MVLLTLTSTAALKAVISGTLFYGRMAGAGGQEDGRYVHCTRKDNNSWCNTPMAIVVPLCVRRLIMSAGRCIVFS